MDGLDEAVAALSRGDRERAERLAREELAGDYDEAAACFDEETAM